MRFFIVFALSIMGFTLCAQDSVKRETVKVKTLHLKRIKKDNYFYVYEDNGGATNPDGSIKTSKIYLVKPKASFWGIIKDEGSYITVKQDPKDKRNQPLNWDTICQAIIPDPTGSQVNFAQLYYFPETFFPKIELKSFPEIASTTPCQIEPTTVKYFDTKFVFQAVTIPLKFRKAVDTFPYQTEAGVNIGFGVGYKWAKNWFKKDKGVLGQRTNQVSMTPGILLGAGVVDVKAKSNAPATFKDRKDPFISYGGFLMFGINTVNFGYAIGKDVALKDGGKSGGWAYNNKLWQGVIVAFDIIK